MNNAMEDTPSDRLRRLLSRVEAHVERGEAELGRRKQFAGLGDEDLARIARDRSGPRPDRETALAVLAERHRKGPALSGLLAELFDDPDEEVARLAIRSSPPFDPASTERLRALLDDPREGPRSEAALVLSRRKDPEALRRISPWLIGEDPARVRVALDCLEWLLPIDDRADLLGRALDRLPVEDADRRIPLAEALRRLDEDEDDRGD